MWGTFMLDVFREEHVPDVRAALETLLGPDAGTAWSTGGVYVVWNPETRERRCIGIAGDFPERFAQHNGLRKSSANGSKRAQIKRYFTEECG